MPDAALALRLETNTTLTLRDRVAGCLVLQYGQQCSRITVLTNADVVHHPADSDVLGLRLGRDPLWLRPRLSALLGQLLQERRPSGAASAGHDSIHLFPGRTPDRSIPAASLRRHLRKLGIHGAHARNGALLSMAGTVHWKILADLLGMADATAADWHHAAGEDRAAYVARRLRQHAGPTTPE